MKLAALALPFLAIAAVWYLADIASFQSAEEVARAVRGVAAGRFGFVWVPLGFALGTLLFLPVTVLIVGTTLAFEPWHGFAYSMTGALLGAALAYGVGRALGSSVVDAFSGPRLEKLKVQLRAHAFRSTLIVRLVPIGNFTAINLLAGGLRVPFGGFVLGNFVGLLPGILFFTFLSGQLPQALRAPTPLNVALLVGAVAAMVGLGWAVRRWVKRRGEAA